MDRADAHTHTAADFTLVVNDPDPDAYDAEEWRAFFAQVAESRSREREPLERAVGESGWRERLERAVHRRQRAAAEGAAGVLHLQAGSRALCRMALESLTKATALRTGLSDRSYFNGFLTAL